LSSQLQVSEDEHEFQPPRSQGRPVCTVEAIEKGERRKEKREKRKENGDGESRMENK
jgi:hypothetical protein